MQPWIRSCTAIRHSVLTCSSRNEERGNGNEAQFEHTHQDSVIGGSAFDAALGCKQFVVLTVKTGEGGKCNRNGLEGVMNFGASLLLRTNK